MFAPQKKTLSFEQHNKQFANDCENSKFPPSAFTHVFNHLVKFFHSLVDCTLSQITCSACFQSLAKDFMFLVRNCQKIRCEI